MNAAGAELPRLIALTPGALRSAEAPRLLRGLELALAAGLPGLLVREPLLPDRAWLELFAALRARCEDHPGVLLAVHDRAHLARALGARALHLGHRSLRPEELRPWLGPDVLLGLSTHARDDPRSWSAADYLFHGPLRDTPSKRGRLAPLGFEGLARAVASAGRPLFAIGGVRPGDCRPVVESGAHGVAVLSGILGAEDPGQATAAYLSALEDAA